jgi:hypothetical protein
MDDASRKSFVMGGGEKISGKSGLRAKRPLQRMERGSRKGCGEWGAGQPWNVEAGNCGGLVAGGNRARGNCVGKGLQKRPS